MIRSPGGSAAHLPAENTPALFPLNEARGQIGRVHGKAKSLGTIERHATDRSASGRPFTEVEPQVKPHFPHAWETYAKHMETRSA
jgi:hypothetical protein